MVKVSVLIPVYNVEKYLEECLDSVINQTLKDIEIICVNDGSTDNSLEILEKYAKKDERIKIITQENKGLGAARNVAMKNAIGDYVFFLDSDDKLFLDALEKLYINAINNNSDIVLYKLARFVDEKELNYNIPGYDLEKIFEGKDFNNFVFDYKSIKKYVLLASFSACLKLYKNDFIEKFVDLKFQEKIYFEDVLFHVKTLLNAESISYVPEYLYKYRLSNDNSIINQKKQLNDLFYVINSVKEYLKKNNYFKEFYNFFIHFEVTQITNYIDKTNSNDYFLLSKKIIKEIDQKFNLLNLNSELIVHDILNKLEYILFSDSIIEYKLHSKIYDLEKENHILKNENEKLKALNYNLNKTITKYDCITLENETLVKENNFFKEKLNNFDKDYIIINKKFANVLYENQLLKKEVKIKNKNIEILLKELTLSNVDL